MEVEEGEVMNGITIDAWNSSGFKLTYQSYVLGPPGKYSSCVIGRSARSNISIIACWYLFLGVEWRRKVMNGATTDVLKELWVRHTYITVSLFYIVSHWIESDFVCIASCSNACITCCFSRARHWIGRHENHQCIIGCPRPLLLNGHRFREASHRSIFLPFEWASQPCFFQVKNLIFTPAS